MGILTQARRAMVDSQVRVNDVTEPRIQNAMLDIERDQFVPKSNRAAAYSDIDISIADGRYMMKPRDFAKILQGLNIQPDDLALDIGAGSGYASAVISQLAETVVALEENEELITQAERSFRLVDVDNVALIKGSFCAGVSDQAPYNVIFVGGAVVKTPNEWLQQLADGGRLGVIERDGAAGQAKIYTRSGGVIGSRVLFDAQTPYLPGFEPPNEFEF